MASETDLRSHGFQNCVVEIVRLGINHIDPNGLGPFCRLKVSDSAPETPGVYAWTVDGTVHYIGMSRFLRQITQGSRMGRPYNDYTYIPPSKVLQTFSPRVRVNGLLNAALEAGSTVAWWWSTSLMEDCAAALEAELIGKWHPDWNRAHPFGPSSGPTPTTS